MVIYFHLRGITLSGNSFVCPPAEFDDISIFTPCLQAGGGTGGVSPETAPRSLRLDFRGGAGEGGGLEVVVIEKGTGRSRRLDIPKTLSGYSRA